MKRGPKFKEGNGIGVLKDWRVAQGISRREAAQILNCNPRTIQDCEEQNRIPLERHTGKPNLRINKILGLEEESKKVIVHIAYNRY